MSATRGALCRDSPEKFRQDSMKYLAKFVIPGKSDHEHGKSDHDHEKHGSGGHDHGDHHDGTDHSLNGSRP